MTAYALSDSATMLRRSLLHLRRYPSLTVLILGMPIVFLLLFVYIFGGTLGSGLHGAGLHTAAGLPAAITGRAAYVNYVTPAIILLTAAAVAQGTAISVASDMTEGIIARFRTMAIAPSSVLTGHVLGSLIQAVLGMAVVTGVAVGVGFRPTATPLEWLAAAGLLVLVSLAFTWLTVGLGLAARSVETASNSPMFLILLPFLGSGFVPTGSMPAGLRWFAEYQPFTPITETLRGLLMGTGIGHQAWLALAWCLAITLGSYLWARNLYRRRPSRLWIASPVRVPNRTRASASRWRQVSAAQGPGTSTRL
jgi:ABC-2 type transport system permease protein